MTIQTADLPNIGKLIPSDKDAFDFARRIADAARWDLPSVRIYTGSTETESHHQESRLASTYVEALYASVQTTIVDPATGVRTTKIGASLWPRRQHESLSFEDALSATTAFLVSLPDLGPATWGPTIIDGQTDPTWINYGTVDRLGKCVAAEGVRMTRAGTPVIEAVLTFQARTA